MIIFMFINNFKILIALNFVAPTICQDEVRVYMNGVKIECTDNLIKFISTDANRLSYISFKYETKAEICGLPNGEYLFNKDYITDFIKYLKIEETSRKKEYRPSTLTFCPLLKIDISAKNLIDGEFPNYKHLLNTQVKGENDITIGARLNAKYLSDAMKSFNYLSYSKECPIIISPCFLVHDNRIDDKKSSRVYIKKFVKDGYEEGETFDATIIIVPIKY